MGWPKGKKRSEYIGKKRMKAMQKKRKAAPSGVHTISWKTETRKGPRTATEAQLVGAEVDPYALETAREANRVQRIENDLLKGIILAAMRGR